MLGGIRHTEGYRVVRVWNNDVSQNVEGVMEIIYAPLYGASAAEPRLLKHDRHRPSSDAEAVTPPRRVRRRPSPSRGYVRASLMHSGLDAPPTLHQHSRRQ